MTYSEYVSKESVRRTAINDWYAESPQIVADCYQAKTNCSDEMRAVYEECCEEAKTVVSWGFLIGCVAVLALPAKIIFKIGKTWGKFRKR